MRDTGYNGTSLNACHQIATGVLLASILLLFTFLCWQSAILHTHHAALYTAPNTLLNHHNL